MVKHKLFPLLVVTALLMMHCSSSGPEIPSLDEILISDNTEVNPFGVAPLSGLLSIETKVPVQVQVEVAGYENDAEAVTLFRQPLTNHKIPILGLYPGTNNLVKITYLTEDGFIIDSKEYTFVTGHLSDDMPTVVIDHRNSSQMTEGWTFVSYFGFAQGGSSSPQRPFMFDMYGDIRWYLDFTGHPILGGLFYDDGMERLENGNLYFGDGNTNKIYEINMLGEILNTWDMQGYGFHHQVLEKPDGNFLVTVNKLSESTIEDFVIEIDRELNTIVNEWDLRESLQYDRQALTTNDVDWFHANAIEYSESDDCIIVSGRTQGVVKLTSTNEIVWIMGPHRGWGTAGDGTDLTNYLLQPVFGNNNTPITDPNVLEGSANHAAFEWNWYQHAPQLLPNGNIMLFDNGDNRNFSGTGPYSRAVEFEIDEANKTIKQIWQYGRERGNTTYSRIVSDIDYFPEDKHVFFSPGAVSNSQTYGKVVEVDYTTGNVLFEATILAPQTIYIITFHRTERMNIYD